MSTSATTTDAAPNPVFGGGVRLGAEELDAINRALSEIVVPFTTLWSALLGQEVDVAVGEIGPGPTARPPELEPDPTASILDGLADPDAYPVVGAFGGELGTVVLVVPTALGLVVVDVLLGGTGRPSGERTLSAIDQDLLRSVAPPTFAALRRLGPPERVDDAVPLLDGIEEHDLSARIAAGITVTLSVTICEHTEPLIVVFGPAAARHLAGAGTTTTTSEAPAGSSRAVLRSVLADVVVEAVVTFPPVQVPSHRILGLDVGDVIGLGTDPDHPLPLRVDGLHLADVRPARSGNDVACQVVSTAVGDSTAPHHHGGLL